MSQPSPPAVAQPPQLRILNAAKAVTSERCQSLYLNALAALGGVTRRGGDPLQSAVYLRALYQTQRCDQYHNLTAARMDVVRELGVQRATRIIEPVGGSTKEDFVEAHRTTRHLATDHRRVLVKALTHREWVLYHATAGVESVTALVGAIGGLFGSGSAARSRAAAGVWTKYAKETQPIEDTLSALSTHENE